MKKLYMYYSWLKLYHGQDLPGPKEKVTVDLKKTDLELFKAWLQLKIIRLKIWLRFFLGLRKLTGLLRIHGMMLAPFYFYSQFDFFDLLCFVFQAEVAIVLQYMKGSSRYQPMDTWREAMDNAVSKLFARSALVWKAFWID